MGREDIHDISNDCDKCHDHKRKARSKKCHEKKEHENRCKGCVCDQLRKLQTGTVVDLFFGGQRIEDVVFVLLNEKNCCATFTAIEDEPAGSILIVDCRRIDAIIIEGREC